MSAPICTKIIIAKRPTFIYQLRGGDSFVVEKIKPVSVARAWPDSVFGKTSRVLIIETTSPHRQSLIYNLLVF